jgi:hypothetical protein
VADRRPREQVESLVVRNLLAVEDAAVAVGRVLAQADVGDEHELRDALAERPERLLDGPVVVPGARPLIVLLLRDSEEQERRDAQFSALFGLGDGLLDREAREGRQRVIRQRLGRDEDRQHEVLQVEPRLTDKRPQSPCPP